MISSFASNTYSFQQDANTLCSALHKDRNDLTLEVTSLNPEYLILMSGFCEKGLMASCELLSEEFEGFWFCIKTYLYYHHLLLIFFLLRM